MTTPNHHWHLERHARYVERGTCTCTAVKFFPNDFCKEALEEAEKFNKKFGKPGDPKLHKENKIVEILKTTETLPPPKPPLDSMKGGAAGRILHKYYINNGTAIVVDFEKLGEKPMLERWGISDSGWQTLRATLMPDRFQKPDWRKGNKVVCVNKPKRIVPEGPSLKVVPVKETTPTAKLETDSPPIVGHVLPPFPIFGNDWPEGTQIEWIKAYRELVTR